MKKVITALIICFILFGILPVTYGAWQGPFEIIVGQWGKDSHQFGIERGDTGDIFPKSFGVSNSGKVVIADNINEVLHIFNSDGSFWKNISKPVKRKWWPYSVIVNGECAVVAYTDYTHIFDLETGKLKSVATNIGGASYISNDCLKIYVYKGSKKWKVYSPTGQLLETYKEKPLELGKVKERSTGSKRYKVTIKYPDKEWVVISKGACSRYVRDLNCNLYCPGHRQVIKYDEDGNEAARLTMPKKIAEETPARDPGVEAIIKVIEEYGPPVVSPNGDIYAWKRTPDTYSIVKWTWQGPTYAPQSLKVASSKKSINLTWKPPLEEAKAVKEYEIVRSDEICGQFTSISTVPKNTLKYEDKDVSEGTNYCYKVSAVRASGSSEYSNKAAGKISVSQTTSMEATGNAYSKVEKDILADKSIHTAKLHSFNKTELKLLRNTIFAKYGRSFKSDMLKTWFAKKSWYKVNPNYSDKVLTNTDKKNITTFHNLEKKK